MSLSKYDPLPLDDGYKPLGKMTHVFEVGDKVTVFGVGEGKVESTTGSHTVNVLLNGGRRVEVRRDELEPVGFSVMTNRGDNLVAAIHAGKLTPTERVLLGEELRKYHEGSGPVDPMPDGSRKDSRLSFLRVMLSKYGGEPANTLAKRARKKAADFAVGMRVRSLSDSRVGRITKLGDCVATVDYGNSVAQELLDYLTACDS
jgi:hypothetical protein